MLLIQGPPGTGKTTVITEIVKQLVSRGEKILVTSQTHIAVDNVLERIKDDKKFNIARIGHEDTASDFAVEFLIDEARKKFAMRAQKFVDIKIEIINHRQQGRNISEISRESFESSHVVEWEGIEDFISLVQTSDDEQIVTLSELLGQWKKVTAKTPKLLTGMFLRDLNVVFGTCIGIATSKELTASELIFDTVILDEAGKANISETLTAISRSRKIILVGDHKQLPPYLDKESVDYFMRFTRDVSDQKTNVQEIKQALSASFFEYLQKEGVLNSDNKIMLQEQHRMHPDIANFVSESFYDSKLVNGEHTHGNVIIMSEPFNKQIIFIDTSSDFNSFESLKDGSYLNQVEAEFIVKKVIPELERNGIKQGEYAIVSPYSKQCQKIRELLLERNNNLNSIEVATLDSFQGREHDIIIFSFTRSSRNKKVGFLDDARRLNVAFSRAKKKLILIGNAETLLSPRSHYDPYYATLFHKLKLHASRYGKVYRINELNSEKVQDAFKVGEIKKAKVSRFEDYGVLVNIGTTRGLIPKHELSWRPAKATDILKLHQTIEVKIIRVDSRGILLSLRQANSRSLKKPKKHVGSTISRENTFGLFAREFKVHDVVDASVIEIIESNLALTKVIVKLKHGVRGQFFISSKHTTPRCGEAIRVIINNIDRRDQIIECKLKQ